MSKVFIEESTLTSIGNAIRNKTGETALIAPLDMPTKINGISTGGGATLPEEALNIKGDCNYRFANNGWNWFINNYGSQVTTNNITNCEGMFLESDSLTAIPFSINTHPQRFSSALKMFKNNENLLALPEITGRLTEMEYMFSGAKRIQKIPENYALLDFSETNDNSHRMDNMFADCYSLRTIPSDFLKQCYSSMSNTYSAFYHNAFSGCYVLDEIVGIPTISVATFTRNAFSTGVYSGTFWKCTRAKNIIFITNEDGTAKIARWKNQTIDLTQLVGYNNPSFRSVILNYNSGITADKEVTDDATYAALKDDPDWFTCQAAYSRYNKTSAIATINSLPDTSAYIAANGGTNTITFTGAAGSATDGGAINTMTEEEIAVATAKGWTVTFD